MISEDQDFTVSLVLFHFLGYFIILFSCIDSEQGPNIYNPSPKYVMPFSENNYKPPIQNIPANPYPQSNNIAIPVSPYQQANPLPPKAMPLPQPNIIPLK